LLLSPGCLQSEYPAATLPFIMFSELSRILGRVGELCCFCMERSGD
jgi:hypothetical protein